MGTMELYVLIFVLISSFVAVKSLTDLQDAINNLSTKDTNSFLIEALKKSIPEEKLDELIREEAMDVDKRKKRRRFPNKMMMCQGRQCFHYRPFKKRGEDLIDDLSLEKKLVSEEEELNPEDKRENLLDTYITMLEQMVEKKRVSINEEQMQKQYKKTDITSSNGLREQLIKKLQEYIQGLEILH